MSEALAVHESDVATGAGTIRSALRHLDPEAIDEAAQRETRNREVHLPPVSVYRWWARRTHAVNDAILEAFGRDRPGRLTVADPFAGGGVIPLAALLRGHQVYAQDLNPWAAQGLAVMLGLPAADEIEAAGERLRDQAAATLRRAYRTRFPDDVQADVSHTFRVAVTACSTCEHRHRLFPHALVSLKRRRERKRPEAFLACPAGHLFEGREGKQRHECPDCARSVDPGADYTRQRLVTCPECGDTERLEARAESGAWAWEVVLVERAGGRRRELGLPTAAEIEQAEGSQWQPRRSLGAIPDGQETRVLTRHGFAGWGDIYPRRQRVVMETLLDLAAEATDETRVRRALELAVVGTAEMAGLLSRWDRYYLKSYEAMAGHRFNFSTFVAEPNVWGTQASGRGTVHRRLRSFAKAARWMEQRGHAKPAVEGPFATGTDPQPLPDVLDVRVVEGDSASMLIPDGSVDVALTDPPYHDDVQYGELSLPLREWARLSTTHLTGEASVNPGRFEEQPGGDYQQLLAAIFAEVKRTLRPDGHLVFSYANRSPAAWTALFGALKQARFRAAGYAIVHSENETDYAKRGVRACRLDFVMDLVPIGERDVEPWAPSAAGSSDEVMFLRELGRTFLALERLGEGWEDDLADRLKATEFLAALEPEDPDASEGTPG